MIVFCGGYILTGRIKIEWVDAYYSMDYYFISLFENPMGLENGTFKIGKEIS